MDRSWGGLRSGSDIWAKEKFFKRASLQGVTVRTVSIVFCCIPTFRKCVRSLFCSNSASMYTQLSWEGWNKELHQSFELNTINYLQVVGLSWQLDDATMPAVFKKVHSPLCKNIAKLISCINWNFSGKTEKSKRCYHTWNQNTETRSFSVLCCQCSM